MLRFDATNAECLVFSYKEGLLSSVAHDLKLTVSRFSVEAGVAPEQLSLKAEFDARSLRVVSAMRDGEPASGLLGAADRQKIEQNIVSDVLDAGSYPQISFVSTEIQPIAGSQGFRVQGRLTLHGRTRELDVATRVVDGRQVAEVTLHQPDFGIKPYSALLGTLRIRPNVTVRLTLPIPELPAAHP